MVTAVFPESLSRLAFLKRPRRLERAELAPLVGCAERPHALSVGFGQLPVVVEFGRSKDVSCQIPKVAEAKPFEVGDQVVRLWTKLVVFDKDRLGWGSLEANGLCEVVVNRRKV